MSPEKFPSRVDASPTARCNLEPACPMCIGPDRSITNELDTGKWKRVIGFFADRGTTDITFTGGEPLVRKDIGFLLEYAKSCGMRVTLSTNALRLPDHLENVANYVDEIGIPIDGPIWEIHSKLRPGGEQQLEAAISAVSLIQEANPQIEITIRTVTTAVNIDNLDELGNLLEELSGIDRWKIYQLVPTVGIVFTDSNLNWDTLKIDPDRFDRKIADLTTKFPNLNIVPQTISGQTKGYVLVGPDGKVGHLFNPHIGDFRNTPLDTLEANLSGLINRF